MTEGLAPRAEKVTTGFWAPNGQLIVKTRRESRGCVGLAVDHECRSWRGNGSQPVDHLLGVRMGAKTVIAWDPSRGTRVLPFPD